MKKPTFDLLMAKSEDLAKLRTREFRDLIKQQNLTPKEIEATQRRRRKMLNALYAVIYRARRANEIPQAHLTKKERFAFFAKRPDSARIKYHFDSATNDEDVVASRTLIEMSQPLDSSKTDAIADMPPPAAPLSPLNYSAASIDDDMPPPAIPLSP